MNWDSLITDKRLGMEDYHAEREESRSDYQRDYDRMIFSSPFRRLQNKTQVFPLPGHIFVHNRLTHSLEVSSVGRSMATVVARMLRERHKGKSWSEKFAYIGDIVAAACLCHDIGNPPFGHSGEKTISTFFSEGAGRELQESLTERQWGDFIHFEGNANSLRLLSHQFAGRRSGGYAMTYSTLATIVKYPYMSLKCNEEGKFGYFESEEGIWRKISEELEIPEVEPGKFVRHPLVYLLEAADDICYQIMDIEDAHRLKILTTNRVKSLFLEYFPEAERRHRIGIMDTLTDPNEQIAYLRSGVIGLLVKDCARVFVESEEEILRGDMRETLISRISSQLNGAYMCCSDIAYDRIYRAQEVVDVEIAGNRILTALLSTLIEAVMNPETHYSRLLLERIPQQYETRSPELYGKIQSVLDHISGMTDIYALDLYRKINGHSLPAV